MSSQSSIKAGAAYVEISLKNSKLVKGLKEAGKSLKDLGDKVADWGKQVAEVGAGITAPLLAAGKIFAEMGDQVAKASQRTGIGVESLSELGFAAEQSGTDFDTMEKGVRKMQQTLLMASEGSLQSAEAFGLLGLKIKNLDGLSPEKQFKLIADHLSTIKDASIRAAIAQQIFGRAGTQLIPMLANGAKGIEELQAQARSLGLTISTKDAEAAVKLTDSMNIAWRTLKQVAFTVGAALAPAMIEVAETIAKVSAKAIAWAKANSGLLVSALKIGAGIAAAGAAIIGIGASFTVAGTVIAGFTSVLGAVGTAFGIVGGVLAAILSPIGLVIAGVVALGAYVLYATGAAGAAIQWLGKQFVILESFAKASFGGIADALAAGDISLAAKVLWASLKLAWAAGIDDLVVIWEGFKEWMVDAGAGVFYGLLAATEIAWDAMKDAWVDGAAFIQKIWQTLMNWHAQAVEGMANEMVKAWIWAREKTGTIDAGEAKRERDYQANQYKTGSDDINAQSKKALDAIEADKDKSKKAEADRHAKALGDIGTEYNKIAAGAKKVHDDKLADAQAELDKATIEWGKTEIKAVKEHKKVAAAGGPLSDVEKKIKDSIAQFGGLDDILQSEQHKIAARGTFNASDTRGFGADGPSDALVAAAKATAMNTQKIYSKLSNGGAVFSGS